MKTNLIIILVLIFSSQLSANPNLEQEITFTSQQSKLSGTLVLPATKEIKAAVVFVHGSGKQTRSLQVAHYFANASIAAFVYDKRGVGKSEGEYEQKQGVSEKNLQLLADDALAALDAVASQTTLKGVPLGLTGISQAGWIVPLSAQKSLNLDFIVLWSGPVSKVSEEDIYSKYTRDKDTSTVASYNEALKARNTPYIWPTFLGKDTNSTADLAKLDVPGLWIFGEQDGSIPVDLSIQNLKQLKKQGHRYEYVLFSNAGHNNMRVSFATVNNWIHRMVEDSEK